MSPEEQRRQAKMLDSIYGAPSLKEQAYFRQGGNPMGPPTEAMEMQQHPFGREEDAFNHEPPKKESMWFIDQMDGPDAVLMRDDQTMRVPAEVLPQGAKEGLFFDPQSGKFSGGEGRGDQMRRGMVEPDEDDMDLGG